MHNHFRFDRLRRRAAARATAVMPVIALAVAVLASGCGTAGPPQTTGPPGATVQPPATGAPAATGAPNATGPMHATGAPHATAGLPTAAGLPAAGEPRVSAQPKRVQAVQSSAALTARLPAASTYGTTRGAPQDPSPFKPETGTVLHPTTSRVIYSRPGGPAVAVLPVTELGSPTWSRSSSPSAAGTGSCCPPG